MSPGRLRVRIDALRRNSRLCNGRQRILALIAALLSGTPLLAQDFSMRDLDAAFDKTTLVISSSEHACYVFDTYIAIDSPQRSRGLMFVRHMPEFTGMVFVYERPAQLSMWMKNTYIPLDILFFTDAGKIVSIAQNTEPLSLKSIASTGLVTHVLELNAGVTENLGIDSDSQIIFTALD